jgi:hypothetical protein
MVGFRYKLVYFENATASKIIFYWRDKGDRIMQGPELIVAAGI